MPVRVVIHWMNEHHQGKKKQQEQSSGQLGADGGCVVNNAGYDRSRGGICCRFPPYIFPSLILDQHAFI